MTHGPMNFKFTCFICNIWDLQAFRNSPWRVTSLMTSLVLHFSLQTLFIIMHFFQGRHLSTLLDCYCDRNRSQGLKPYKIFDDDVTFTTVDILLSDCTNFITTKNCTTILCRIFFRFFTWPTLLLIVAFGAQLPCYKIIREC
jgi:hypothetical protein